MPYKDKDAIREYQQARVRYHKNRMRRFKVYKGCAQCGYKAHADALQFDHIVPIERPEGSHRSVGSIMAKSNAKRETLKAALSETQVLCANCHAIKSAAENRKRNARN